MTQTPGGGAGGSQGNPDIDWEAVARSPEFLELLKRKKAFVIPATLFFMAWYFGFIILSGYAPDFMGREFITDGVTVGYAFALSQFVMTWVLGWMYLRKADRDFELTTWLGPTAPHPKPLLRRGPASDSAARWLPAACARPAGPP